MSRPGPYGEVVQGEWTDVPWRDHREQCCSCSLVHRIDYRMIEKGGRQHLQFRCWQDDKATAKIRKRRGIKL